MANKIIILLEKAHGESTENRLPGEPCHEAFRVLSDNEFPGFIQTVDGFLR